MNVAAAKAGGVGGVSVDQIEMILSQVDALPTLPTIATRLLSISNVDDADLDQIVEMIEVDPTLTARVLGLCRSAEKGLGDKISTVRRAVVMLGLEAVQAALLSVGVFEAMKPRLAAVGKRDTASEHEVAFDRDGYWRHSLAVASAAELIAEKHVDLGIKPEEAFVAGLLHDIGKLALEVILPRAYGRVLGLAERRQTSSAEAEKQLLGLDHHTVGKRLAGHWGLPDAVLDVVWLCGQPMDAMPDQPHRTLIGIVWAARSLCRSLHLGWSGDFNQPEAMKGPAGVAKRAGLSVEAIESITPRVHEALARRCSVLGLGEQSTPEMLLQALSTANAKLGRMASMFEGRSRAAQRQSRVLAAIAEFHRAAGGSTRNGGLAGTFVSIVRSAASLLGTGLLGVAIQTAEGEAWNVCRVGPDGKPGRMSPLDPSSQGTGALSPMCAGGPGAARVGAVMGTLASGMASLGGRGGDAVVWPILGDASGPCVALVHEESALGGLEPALVEPLVLGWSNALSSGSSAESAARLGERLAAANRTLVETQAKLSESQALAKLGEFAAGAAHEMNNPLTVISTRAQMLADSAASDADRAASELIVEQTNRLSDLITSMRLIADPPRPRIESTNFEAIVRSAAAVAQERLGGKGLGADLAVRIPSPDVPLTMDRPMVASALAELIVNAVQASAGVAPTEGETGVGARVEVIGEVDDADGRCVLVVRDRGHGMSERALAHAFDPFFSERAAGRRTGLGLTRARVLIESHGGEISLRSQVGEGTTARIVLPLGLMTTPGGARG